MIYIPDLAYNYFNSQYNYIDHYFNFKMYIIILTCIIIYIYLRVHPVEGMQLENMQ